VNDMNIMIINGPNLDMLGMRQPEIYGKEDYDDLCYKIDEWAGDLDISVDVRQSNYEGEIVEFLHEAFEDDFDGVIINPAAYTHYSYAIRDALLILNVPVVEVHLTDITQRDEFRRHSVISDICAKTIMGKGFEGYKEALEFFFDLL